MYRDFNFDSAIAFARDLIRIPSISGDEGAVAERVLSEFKLLGFDDAWIDEIGNVFGRVKGRANAPAVMLSSHLDIVDAGDRAEWEYPPFEGQVAQGCLHGRGAVDCKGPLALQTYAAARLLESRSAGDVYVVHTVLEECGSWGMAHAMDQLSDRISAVILGEATEGEIRIGHRGRIECMVTIRGQSAHASAPQRAFNPVDLLPAVLAALTKYAEQIPSHEVLPRSTLVPTIIETWPTSRNMVPEEVRILIDWRTLPLARQYSTVDGLRHFLQSELNGNSTDAVQNLRVTVDEVSIKQRAYTGWERTMPISTHGFLVSESHPVVEAAIEAIRAITGHIPAVRPWTFGTDGGYPCGVYGIPTIGYAPGTESCSHTNRERLELESARIAYDVYPTLIRQVQQALQADGLADSHATASSSHLFLGRLKRI
jgi:succinyl-diaminopimelate desuccinylase